MNIIQALFATNLFASKSEIKRLIIQKGVKVDWKTVDLNFEFPTIDFGELHPNECEKVKAYGFSEVLMEKDNDYLTTISEMIKRKVMHYFKADSFSEKWANEACRELFVNYFVLQKGKKEIWILEFC